MGLFSSIFSPGLGTGSNVKGTPSYKRKKKKERKAAEAAASEASEQLQSAQEERGRTLMGTDTTGSGHGKEIVDVYKKPSLEHLSKVGPVMTGPKYSRYFSVTTTPTAQEIKHIYGRRRHAKAKGMYPVKVPEGSYSYDGTIRTHDAWKAIEPNWMAGHQQGGRWTCPTSDPECRYLKWYKSKFDW